MVLQDASVAAVDRGRLRLCSSEVRPVESWILRLDTNDVIVQGAGL